MKDAQKGPDDGDAALATRDRYLMISGLAIASQLGFNGLVAAPSLSNCRYRRYRGAIARFLLLGGERRGEDIILVLIRPPAGGYQLLDSSFASSLPRTRRQSALL